MRIIGSDFHPGYQQIAVLDLATGEMVEKALSQTGRSVRFRGPLPVGSGERVAAGGLLADCQHLGSAHGVDESVGHRRNQGHGGEKLPGGVGSGKQGADEISLARLNP
jgi:hypothetical protein